MAENIVDLHDRELVKIGQVSHALYNKFSRRQWHSQTGLLLLMDEIEKEAKDRFLAIGFHVQVDTSPMIAGMPPSISIASRSGSSFDVEEKSWEINKANERSEAILHGDKNPMGTTVTGEEKRK